jgi:hypothetical protein
MADSDKDYTFIPDAPAIVARSFATPLSVQKTSFQRGLGDAGKCLHATITFDDLGTLPVLAFHVELEGGAVRVFGEHVATNESAAFRAEERGAACRTAIKAGLIRPPRGGARHHA